MSARRHRWLDHTSEVVVDVVHDAGLARKVARLVPLGVVKG